MNTVTISKKEYNALVFVKAVKGATREESSFLEAGFGLFKKSFGKVSSVSFINKIREPN